MTAFIRRVPSSIKVSIPMAIVVLVVFFVASSANNQREQALVQHEASQAAVAEQSTLSTVLSVLDTLASTTTISDGSTQAFQTEAQSLVHAPVSVALAKAYLSEYVVFAQVGRRVSGRSSPQPRRLCGDAPHRSFSCHGSGRNFGRSEHRHFCRGASSCSRWRRHFPSVHRQSIPEFSSSPRTQPFPISESLSTDPLTRTVRTSSRPQATTHSLGPGRW